MNRTNILFAAFSILASPCLKAQNPLVMDQFTADPSARVFNGKVYVYPSHDIPCGPGQGHIGFCMADYHVFSSENLTDWVDHGVILTQNDVPWVDSSSYSMWAPDCINRNGKYYFYFPAIEKGKLEERGRTIGVAVSDTPHGPFTPEEKPIAGISGIDPNPFIDKDGQAYLYWAHKSELFMARLGKDMKHITTEPQMIKNLPEGFKEGPYLFERNGIYYFTFPHVANETERLAYATGDHPMGPFTYQGVIMDESPIDCWTNHHSILTYKGQWYLFYHHNDLSPDFDKNRSMQADSLFFNEDGTIRKVIPSFRGVGVSRATGKIQIDRYSASSASGVKLNFVDETQKMLGWKVTLSRKHAWVRYNQVSFAGVSPQSVRLKSMTDHGGLITIRLDKPDGPIVAEVEVPASKDRTLTKADIQELPSGNHDIFVILGTSKNVEIDWIKFE